MKDVNVGFIGLGNVGSRIAENILRGGFKLFINDLNRNLSKNLIEKGAKWSSNLESLASQSTIIITCLPSPVAVNNVLVEKWQWKKRKINFNDKIEIVSPFFGG